MDYLVRAICGDKDTWQAVNSFAQRVMGKKEEDEKLEQARKRQEELRDKDESLGTSRRGTNCYYETSLELESD